MATARKSPSASKRTARKRQSAAGFIESMECLPVSKIPEGPQWTYEIKLDGYRLEVVKQKGKVTLYSRRRNILNQKFGYIPEALEDLPDGTVLDGELVALSAKGHADFNMLQNFSAPGQTWCFQRVKFPSRQEVQPPHWESSLGSEEATNRTKRRQSDEQTVT